MAINNPILNPIKFYDPTRTPNYSDRWPNIDNISLYTEWQRGIYPTYFYRDFVLNEEMTLQFRYDSAITATSILVYKMDSSGVYQLNDSLLPLNVSPPAWTGISVYNYTWTPTEIGIYYFDFTGADLLSHKFIVHNDTKYLKRLFKITYTHYENKYGMIFLNGTTNVFTGLAYFQGFLIDGELTNDLSIFTDDPGEVQLLQATPQRNATLYFDQLHYTYADVVNYIFSCNEITINGIQYQNSEVPKKEKIPDSDLVKISVNLFQRDNDHFIN